MVSSFCSFGICPYMTEDNKDQLKGKDLLVAYYDVDYDKNPKGSNYWRNRLALILAGSVLFYLGVQCMRFSPLIESTEANS